ncbi:MAG: hypothetical protein SOW59_03130 [Corynebacterium sp.]|nr:hypothetical protein [Corynebacterium sp.]
MVEHKESTPLFGGVDSALQFHVLYRRNGRYWVRILPQLRAPLRGLTGFATGLGLDT